MLGVTSGICALVYTVDSIKTFALQNAWLFFICFIFVIFVMCYLPCFYKVLRRVPINYFILAAFTLTHSWFIAYITIFYKQSVVIAAAVCTMGMFIALTAYACATKTDLTYMGGLLSVITMMVVLILILMTFFMSKLGYLIMISILIALISVWIVHDTQLIIGGKHRAAELKIDDYIIGALIIYSDILTGFLYLL